MRSTMTVWFFLLGITLSLEPRDRVLPESLDEKEKLNLDAIARIHRHLDDDKNGNVDLQESIEFISDELRASDKNSRQSHFHGADNMISVNDLWIAWKQSEVHNWTNAQVVSWLVEFVHLPQYKDVFAKSSLDGSMLPRLAEPRNGFMLYELGIKDPKHRKKISLRAMDIVLFGPPIVGHNFLKDLVVAASVLVATFGCWAAVTQKKKAKRQIEDLMKDIEIMQEAEQNLHDLQEKLMRAEEEQQMAIEEKLDLEARLKDELQISKREAESLHEARTGTEEQLQRFRLAEQELKMLREALKKAEKELECQSWRAPPTLRQWLHMTYEKESKQFQLKRNAALKRMEEAKESCERIRKKRGSLMGSFRLAHDLTIDEVDQKILGARAALADVTNELEERQQRWSQIESLCGLHIQVVSNHSLVSVASQSTGVRARTNSSIAQALVGCANIGSVGSGRKLSSTKKPQLGASPPAVSVNPLTSSNGNLPPTYSMAVMEGEDEAVVTSSVVGAENVADTRLEPTKKDQSTSPLHRPEKPQSEQTASTLLETINYHAESLDGSGPSGSCNRKASGETLIRRSSSAAACSNINSHDGATTTAGSSHPRVLRPKSDPGSRTVACKSTEVLTDSPRGSPTGFKSKKRHSWFSKKIATNEDSEAETFSTGSTDEESRRKKVKRLWKMAVRNSRSERRQNGKNPLKKDQQSPSSEKLKAG